MNKYIKVKFRLLFIILLIISIDQISKYWIKKNLIYIINKNIIFFSFNYVQNNGAAFNILSGNRFILSSISLISSIILIYIIFIKDHIKIKTNLSLSFILAGSIGNGIDRFFRGFVIDFIDLNFIDFPIFNIADISINIGFIILLINYLKSKE
tara:strand:+ start:6653 stop:7111 length:459 start_codon:yes stop_codon:yes gene_type:complete